MRCEIRDNFLTEDECESIIQMSKPRLAPSYTWSVKEGMSTHTDYRISEQMFFAIGETELIQRIEQEISYISGVPIENGEGLQIVKYSKGGYYKEHWDYFDPTWEGNKPALDRGGQRIVTAIIYLNNLQPQPLERQEGSGGETYFPRINMKVTPKMGTLLMWRNLDDNGQIDQSTYHEAMPVLNGEKWIATKWLRQKKFI